jgi:hypothetical protein
VGIRNYLIATAMAVAAVPAAAVPVAASSNASGQALILVPLTLTKLDDLDFGTVIPSGTSGTVTVNAITGARSFTGGAFGFPSDIGHRAYFATTGSASQTVFVAVDAPLELVNTIDPTAKISVLALTLDGSNIRTIDPVTRSFFFGVGGVIQIDADQAEGVYESTFDVTAIYL